MFRELFSLSALLQSTIVRTGGFRYLQGFTVVYTGDSTVTY